MCVLGRCFFPDKVPRRGGRYTQRQSLGTRFIPLVFLHFIPPLTRSPRLRAIRREKRRGATTSHRSTYLVKPLIRRSCDSFYPIYSRTLSPWKPLNLAIFDSSKSPQLFHYGDPRKTYRIVIVRWIS